MIYLACDDNYFSLGIAALFDAINKSVTVINVNVDGDSVVIPELTREDTLILAAERTNTLTPLLMSARSQGTRTLLVMDNASERTLANINQWSKSVLSKRMPPDCLPQLLEASFVHLKDLSCLTAREMNIMGSLAMGKTPCRISSELNISVKTIFAYKLKALKKLGLNHLNARSLLIFSMIFQGLAPL